MTVINNIYVERKTIKWLTDQIKSGLLSVDNSFQRQYVWTVKNQVKLIETILLGYAIPEIYLWEQDTDSQSGDTSLSIIDGQQRLGSIFDFINDKFSLKNSFLDIRNQTFSNKTFSQLSEDERNTIWTYPVSVRFIKNEIAREDIINMFLRLNSTSTTLNPQELRNAEYDGLFLRLSNQLSDLTIWDDIGLFSGLDYRRMKDIEFISSLLLFIRFGIEEEITQTSINKAYDTFNEEYEDYENDYALFLELVDEIQKIIQCNIASNFLKRKVHFYTLFTLIYYLKNKQIEINQEIIEKYVAFVNTYNSLNTDDEIPHEQIDLIKEYSSLSQEGTLRKGNRIRRFEILKTIIEA